MYDLHPRWGDRVFVMRKPLDNHPTLDSQRYFCSMVSKPNSSDTYVVYVKATETSMFSLDRVYIASREDLINDGYVMIGDYTGGNILAKDLLNGYLNQN